MSAAKKGLGELLVRDNLIGVDELEQARKEQKKKGGRLTAALVRLGHIHESELAQYLGQQYGLPTVNLENFEIDPEAIKLVTRAVCEKNMVIPVSKAGNTLVVAFSDPSNIYVKDDLAVLTRHKIQVVVSPEASINQAIQKYYNVQGGNKFANIMSEIEDSDDGIRVGDGSVEVVDSEADIDDGPIIKFVNVMLSEAVKSGASDIHVESYEKRFRVRYRIDGTLVEKIQPPPGAANAIVSRLKIISKMDISERRRPQDGRLKVKLKDGRDVDFRVNAIPTIFGEKVVLRVLDKSNLQVDLTKLGMEPEHLDEFSKTLHLPQGLVLITGPTGSGKTTTIYSGLNELNSPDTNISTAEDPVEFNLDGINQVQVNASIGFSFADALRAFLRQDPEVIMVGEIRDLETAEVAYKAASTGHLVVSTLHTNDAASTVTRLLDMGIPPFMVAEATSLIVAQRLLRKICTKCASPTTVADEVLLGLGVPEAELGDYQNLQRGEGCSACGGTGTKGRIGVYEMLKMTGAVKEAIFKGATPRELKKYAIQKDGMKSLRASALGKLKEGVATVEEVLNTTISDDI